MTYQPGPVPAGSAATLRDIDPFNLVVPFHGEPMTVREIYKRLEATGAPEAALDALVAKAIEKVRQRQHAARQPSEHAYAYVNRSQPDAQRVAVRAKEHGFEMDDTGLGFVDVSGKTGGFYGFSFSSQKWPKYNESLAIAIRERDKDSVKRAFLSSKDSK